MNKTEAVTIIKNTFNSGFNEDSFKVFISNLFKEYEAIEKVREGQYIKDSFKSFILKYKVIGSYKDVENNSIDILEVALNKSSSLELARTAQRNFIADYLKTNGKGAALVAFVSPKNDDWRLSLVRLEHTLEVVDEKLKTKEEITPAKRWSFLVGKNEGSHTAQSRFTDLLTHDEKPNLSELELAFDIEKVTKEFFDKYTELYFQLKEHLDELLKNDARVKQDFEDKEITTVDFAKKTLGQIVFLYFLQKKGWFGVAPDKSWGEGPKKFIRALFSKRNDYGKNFFNDVLEPLFYEALAQDRGKESIYPRLNNCRMPFLNGGLFEPMNGYHWETTDIIIPDELFSNTNKTKEGDIGDGILDIFDRYNFTVNENEPLEKEVAVDPEMLGKVFENLLEIKDRKSKGAFYTPREIVHYMCQESLINYLESEVGEDIPKEDIETFIRKGDRIVENDQAAIEKRRESEAKGREYKGEYKLLLPSAVVESSEKIDQLLQGIKVADPAVGSGAFPLGMINEIVRARKVLNIYSTSKLSDYKLKLHTISHSIYGVDIDPGAVEITKLRLWLALVVEEKEPHPLPNLEHKIMQGNSLVSEFEGIKLFDKNILDRHTSKKLKQTSLDIGTDEPELEQGSLGLGQSVSEQKMQELKVKIDSYIFESQRSKKETLKNEIDQLKWELIESTLKEQAKEGKLNEVKSLRKKNIRPFFIWELEFSDVFLAKNGFDLVIGNPPYLKERDNKDVFSAVNLSEFGKKYHQGKMDFWYYFLHKALDLVKNEGSIAFITSRYWINSHGAKKLIRRVRNEAAFTHVIDIGKLKVFNDVAGHHMVAIYKKSKENDQFLYKRLENNLTGINSTKDDSDVSIKVLSNKSVFTDSDEIIFDSYEVGLSNIINLGELVDISQGVVQNPDKVSAKAADEFGLEKGRGVFVLTNDELEDLTLEEDEKMFIKPFYDENDVSQYYFKKDNNKNLIYITKNNSTDIKKYPNLERHLKPFSKIMEKRRETVKGTIAWFQMHWPRDPKFFEEPRIVFPTMFSVQSATYIEESAYFGMSTSLMIQKDADYKLKYILAVLNSKFALHWFYSHGKKRGVGVDIGIDKLKSFPIRKIGLDKQKCVEDLVGKMLKIKSKTTYQPSKPPIEENEIREQIDDLIMEIYELKDQEKELIKSFKI